MDLRVENWTLKKNDHLWLEDTHTDWYFDNKICEGCHENMEDIARVLNSRREPGLVTGLCPSCGFVKRTRNLSHEWYAKHFSERWLVRRDEKIIEDQYVFNLCLVRKIRG